MIKTESNTPGILKSKNDCPKEVAAYQISLKEINLIDEEQFEVYCKSHEMRNSEA